MLMKHDIQSRALLRGSMAALLLASLLQVAQRHYPHFHPDLADGLRGLLFGIFLATSLLYIRRRGRRTGGA